MTPRIPAPVIGAIISLCLAALLVIAEVLQGFTNGAPAAVGIALVVALCVVGCWRGWIPMLVFTLGMGALAVFIGLVGLTSANPFARMANQVSSLLYLLLGAAVVTLLLAPKASRDWFILRR